MSIAKKVFSTIRDLIESSDGTCPECDSKMGKKIGDKPRTCIKCGKKEGTDSDGDDDNSDSDESLKADEAVNVQDVIKAVIDTSFGGSNEKQMKAIQLLKGLATSNEPASNKFMQALDKLTSGMNPEDFA